MNTKRIYSIDLLKIFSIFIVIVYHIMMDMYELHPMYNFSILKNILITKNIHLAMFACATFIMVSGATISIKNIDDGFAENDKNVFKILSNFYKKRLVRVLIPFYIVYIIYFIIKIANMRSFHVFQNVPIYRIIFTLCGIDEYMSANGIRTFTLGIGEWFLGCIIFCYIVYPIIYYFDKKNMRLTFFIMTLYYIFLNINYDIFGFKIAGHMNFFSQIYNFYLGVFIIRNNIFEKIVSKFKYWSENIYNVKMKISAKLIYILPTFLILFFYFYPQYINIPDNFKISIITVSCFFIFCNINDIITKNKIITKIILTVSSISFEIFLTHHFIIYQMDYMLKYQKVNTILLMIIILIEFIQIIVLSKIIQFLSGRIIKKIKI